MTEEGVARLAALVFDIFPCYAHLRVTGNEWAEGLSEYSNQFDRETPGKCVLGRLETVKAHPAFLHPGRRTDLLVILAEVSS